MARAQSLNHSSNQHENIRRCVRCITPENYPGVTYDKNGLCSHCVAYDKRFEGWTDKPKDLISLIEKNRDPKSKYSVLVGMSGGKDSSYVLHALVKDYGIKDILAVTNDNGFMNEDAQNNIKLIVEKLGLDHRYYGPDRALNKRVYQALIKKKCSDWCLFCCASMLSGLMEIAKKENIKTVVLGMSPRTEPFFPFEMNNPFDYRYLKNIVSPYVKSRELGPFKNIKLFNAAMSTYVKRINFVNLPEYIEWDDEKIVKILEKEYSWVDYGKGTPHFDCLLNPSVDYFMKKRLGVSKVVEGLSVLVRAGQLTRDEALEKLKVRDSDEIPTESLEEICKRLDVTMEDLSCYMDGTALDYRHFKSTVNLLRKLRFLFWISYKLGLTSRIIYEKYSK